MEETSLAQYLQFSTGSGLQKEVPREVSFCLEDAVILDSDLPFLDSENGQVIMGNSALLEGLQLHAVVIDEPGPSGQTNSSRSVNLSATGEATDASQTPYLTFSQTSSNSLMGNFITLSTDQDLSQFLKNTSVDKLDQASVLLTLSTPARPQENALANQASQIVPSQPRTCEPVSCSICTKLFDDTASLKTHEQDHLNDNPFQCTLCSNVFNYEANLKLHRTLHEAEASGELHCRMCSAKFSRMASLKAHVRVHERDEMCVCRECGDEFTSMALLKAHNETHTNKLVTEHKCKVCGKIFSQASLLKYHASEHASVRKQLKAINSRRRKFKISSASLSGSGPLSTLTHTSANANRLENKKKTRLCTVCGKRFQKPSQLIRHVRIHTGERPFHCGQCDKSFNQKGTLESHVKSLHEKARPFTCNLCNCTFSHRGNLRAHTKKVHAPPGEHEKAFKCKECPCIFRRLTTLNNHISKVHGVPVTTKPDVSSVSGVELSSFDPSFTIPDSNPVVERTISEVNIAQSGDFSNAETCLVKVEKVGHEKWHLCSVCPKSFKKPSDLIRHNRTHTLERPYKCGHCDKTFAVKSTLKTHMAIHSGERKWKCRLCPKAFTILSSLKTHEKVHCPLKPFKCSFEGCDKHFKTSSQRRSHMRVHTRNTMGLTGKRKLLRIGESPKKIELPDALKITPDGLVPVPTRCALSSTDKYPGDAKCRPHRCTYCPSAFKKSSHLKQHILAHTGEKPFQCFQCGRRFVSSGVLKNHIKTHQGVRPYKCEVCNISFTTTGSLKRHTAIHTNARPYLCPFCKKCFKTNVSCRKHIKIHCNRGDVVSFKEDNVGTSEEKPIIVETKPVVHSKQEPVVKIGTQLVEQTSGNREPIQEQKVKTNVSHQPSQGELLPVSMFSDVLCSVLNSPIADFLDDPTPSSYTHQLQEMPVLPINIPKPEIKIPNKSNFPHSATKTIPEIQGPSTGFPPQTIHVTPQVPLKPKVIEINSSKLKAGSKQQSVNKVAVTKLNPVITVSNNSKPGTGPSRPSTSVQTVACNQPIILKTESISLEDLANRNPTTSTIRVPESVQITRIDNVPSSTPEVVIPADEKPEAGRRKKPKVNLCQICGKTFTKHSDLIRHNRIHTGEKPFRCLTCNKSFRVKSTRDAHMRIHDMRKTFTCDVCFNTFSAISSLKVHMRLHSGARPFNCPQCPRSFRTPGHLKFHSDSHSKPERDRKTSDSVQPSTSSNQAFGQTVTHIPYKSKDVLVSSAAQDENSILIDSSINLGGIDYLQLVGNLQLPIDNLQAIQIAGLDINSIAPEDLLQSFILIGTSQAAGGGESETFLSFPNTSADMYVNLPNSTVYTTSGSGILDPNSTHKSDTIQRNESHSAINGSDPFLSVASEQRHTTTKPAEKMSSTPDTTGNKQCPDCGRMFLKPSQMLRHFRVHTGEKPHVCGICNNKFSQKSSLDTHVLYTHSDIRPYKCSLCPFQTVQKAALKKHSARAHPHVRWGEVSAQLSGNNPGISIVNSSHPNGITGGTVTTTQINITTGVRTQT